MSEEDAAAEMASGTPTRRRSRPRASCAAATPCSPTAAATTVRVRDGETQVTDGPFAETREQLGGYYMVECDTLDQAIDAARRIPSVGPGSVEVRPIMEFDLTADGRDAVARVFREEHGRALAVLARVLGDIDRAEDALQDAYAVAARALAARRRAGRARSPGSSRPRATGRSTACAASGRGGRPRRRGRATWRSGSSEMIPDGHRRGRRSPTSGSG